MYSLDTNICIALIKENPIPKRIFDTKAIDCYISTIVLAELYKGVYCSEQFEKNYAGLRNFLSLVEVVEFDRGAALEFGRIQAELKAAGKPTGEQDALIAAVTRFRQDILVTNNTRHFENIANLQLEDWLEP
ncbi:type II toxin-antitoxin system VapC family toxin [Leptolyngbya sp. NIES-2104]|uniref:type II toxin-antitoxin system VapC family toxin n=1 Tax=Leptolyngbya sp. NIES-2104 TaxID=1552121 RepID=UPI0006ECAA50|nr:type II toxin-antitoxin system VapC family toxin [Leptolyngbya sp. NIES-2104]GAP99698.1 VapC toxin protein [Leptolyngbya sp. NIES-2104]